MKATVNYLDLYLYLFYNLNKRKKHKILGVNFGLELMGIQIHDEFLDIKLVQVYFGNHFQR